MARLIPSHSALLAFEAASRHASFARAAEELGVTEGAISRQIARLETQLGVALFARIGNRVRLLPGAARYAGQVRETLNRLERDSRTLVGQGREGAALEIAVLPSFATHWLIPRLANFRERHPEITVHLTARMEPFILPGSGFDAALHFEHPAWSGMRVHRLMQEVLVPVCHPRLLDGRGADPSLDTLPRLHRRQNPDSWRDYAREIGLPLTNPAIGARFETHAMTIEGARAGLGAALVPRVYVERDLEEGRLVAPWPEGRSVSKSFCLVMPDAIGVSEPALQAFAGWLANEAGQSIPAL